MLFGANACRETVSVIEALIFGAGDACIDLGLTSLLSGVALFIGCVVALRIIGSWALRRAFGALRRPRDVANNPVHSPEDECLQRMPYESPIRSTRRWGRSPR
ncbi:MAG: hypothetical protein AAGA06_06565 [Pseudomonadota bacterium]